MDDYTCMRVCLHACICVVVIVCLFNSTCIHLKWLITAAALLSQIPRTGGIKKGWVREYMVVCDFKLFLYEIPADKTWPNQEVQQVVDMR